jgi:microcystin-dependent protein
MSQPFIGEIRMFGFNYAPAGWAFCDGQLMPISENDALFQLIGTTYGGDGQETFALPNLQSRIPLHQGTGPGGTTYQLGEMAGVEEVTLTVNQIPTHNHAVAGNSGAGNSASPTNNVWAANANTAAVQYVAGASANANMNNSTIGPSGGSQPHENMMPFLTISFCISLFGLFPHT